MPITGTNLFVAGNVLTAAQVNQYLMRGVKVYANSTDRDAAYGGAGEPTLEAGEACVLLDSYALQIYTGATTGWKTWPGPGLTYSATVPTNPIDGQIWLHQPTGTATVWSLRYNASSASAHKWEFIGGGPRVIEQYAASSTASTAQNTFAQTTANALEYTVPFAGAYLISYSIGMSVATTSVISYAGIQRGATAPVIGTNTQTVVASTTEYRTLSNVGFFTGDLTASTVVGVRTAHGNAVAQVMNRIGGTMTVIPVRLS